MKKIGLRALVILKWFCCLTRTVMTSTYITARTMVYSNNMKHKGVQMMHIMCVYTIVMVYIHAMVVYM